MWYCSDVSKVEDIERLCESLKENDIEVDILVNNAAIQFENDTIQTFKGAEWQQTFETNLIGPLHLTKIISDRMIQSGTEGSILFITSIHQWAVAQVLVFRMWAIFLETSLGIFLVAVVMAEVVHKRKEVLI